MGILGWLTRKPVQQHKPSQRSYAAASNVARFSDFKATTGSADFELSASMVTLRNKVRSLARNSGLIRRYLELMTENVVGEHGLSFQCRIYKLDKTLDETLNTRVEAEWADFWSAPTVDRKMTGVDLLNLIVMTKQRDGEIFLEIVPDRNAPHGMLINPLEPDMIDESVNTINPVTKNQIRMGVEVADSGEHVAYWVLNQHPGDMFVSGHLRRDRHRRVTADMIIHWYDVLRPGQTRGEPPAVAAINPVKMLDGYREAEVVMRRVKSALMGFFKRIMPKADGVNLLADKPDVTEEPQDMLEMTLTPGLLTQLPDGLDFQVLDPGGTVSDFNTADSTFSKHVDVSLGISDMSLSMNTSGVSYSAGRTITLEDRRRYMVVQQKLIRRVMLPILKQWVKYRMLTTEIVPSRFALVAGNSLFRAQGWEWVDPSKEAKANQVALETGQTTLGEIASQRGMDPNDALQALIREIEAFEKAGLTHPFTAATHKQMGQQSAKADDKADTEDDDDE